MIQTKIIVIIILYQFTDESGQECDQDQGASPESPCFYTVDLILPWLEYNTIHGVSFSEYDNLSLDIEIKSFQTIQILYGNKELDTGITLFTASDEVEDDTETSTEESAMFYLPPEGQTLLPEKIGVTYGILVNSGDYPEVETLEDNLAVLVDYMGADNIEKFANKIKSGKADSVKPIIINFLNS